MVYNWEGKEEACRRLYLDENRSMDEVMAHFRPTGFQASKRAFQCQFRRWGFPSKHSDAYSNDELIARVEEMWKTNMPQAAMVDQLQAEGFEVELKQISRIRRRYKWYMRQPRATDTQAAEGQTTAATLDEDGDEGEFYDAPGEIDDENGKHHGTPGLRSSAVSQHTFGQSQSDDLIAQRWLRKQELQAKSDELWATRKRRRRTRPHGGIAADPPQPPRFPSETTLSESKLFLQLTTPQYMQVRAQFEAICQEEGITKKKNTPPEKWAEVKERLVRGNEHLLRGFFTGTGLTTNASSAPPTSAATHEQKIQGLDVICMDVTKKFRSAGIRMSLAEARSAIGLNPLEACQMRHTLCTIMEREKIETKTLTADDQWEAMQREWIAQYPKLLKKPAHVFPSSEEATAYEIRHKKAMDALNRDAMKRFISEYRGNGVERANALASNIQGPETSRPTAPRHVPAAKEKHTAKSTRSTTAANASDTPSRLELDPSLLTDDNSPTNNANTTSSPPSSRNQRTARRAQSASTKNNTPASKLSKPPRIPKASAAIATTPKEATINPFAPLGNPIPATFRIVSAPGAADNSAPDGTSLPHLWTARLTTRSMSALLRLAAKNPWAGTHEVARVEAVMQQAWGGDGGSGGRGGEGPEAEAGGAGGEGISRPVGSDGDLIGYLAAIGWTGAGAAFNVLLKKKRR